MLESTKCKWLVKTFEGGEKVRIDPDTLYLIKQGAVKISTYDLSGKTIILGYWGKGDVVGQSLTKIDPYEIKCLISTEVDCVPYPDWHQVAKEIRSCYQDAEKLLYILGQNGVEEKLLELLIYLGNKFGSIQANGKAILLPLSHRELAEFLGATRVSITRSMNKLQSKKLIEYPKRGTIILHTSQISRLNYKI
ncbi:Crp/Fnr family transcriptional regulator [Waterburya agarophytonicola K14]|uniref:Crp/Fnr family transcriptional regulator n=1 Tax=Waterburya agarophytonicola KI4 TaxID=2874699 RepID=A0A964BU25_9CYAN|nr:Crp/Fnr family transcriptional regulator [Waterburya agarophytonicola]MCC0178187.1 Crp/Fnr family transcriptional regulator [Waterburya agarophytonicola KI4]